MTKPLIFIAYPSVFNCKSKFDRRIKNITRNIECFDLVYISDPQGFIYELSQVNEKITEVIHINNIEDIETIDYGIIFSEHELMTHYIKTLKLKKIKIRVVDTPITQVVNIDKGEDYDEYIGRGSLWGNPFALGIDGDREEVIDKYAYHYNKGWLKFSHEQLINLRGKTLGCHCKPAACHGDVLAAFLNQYDDGN